MDFPAQKAAFLRKLRLRPGDCPPPRDRIRFQFVDLKVGGSQVVMPMRPKSRTYLSESMGDKEYDTDTVAALFGTAEDGHSVCVMVKDFEPYFDLSMDDGWVDEHFDKIARYFSRTKDPLRYKTYRGPAFSATFPDADGQPKVSTWLRLHFPTMGALRSVMRSIDRDRKGVLRKIFPTIDPETDVHLRFVFELAGHQNSIEQMFLAYTNLVPSGWVTVESPVPHSADATTCQWEVQAPVRALRPDDSAAIAPCLTLSFDIECVPEKTRNMPQAYRHQDFVVQIGVSLEVFGGEKRHGVICLGDTGPVENVAILSCPTEFQLLEAFRDLVVATDPDMITGYNIYKFDFFYMSQRVQRYEIFREKSPAELLAIRKGLQEYTKEEKEESVIAAAFQGRRPRWCPRRRRVPGRSRPFGRRGRPGGTSSGATTWTSKTRKRWTYSWRPVTQTRSSLRRSPFLPRRPSRPRSGSAVASRTKCANFAASSSSPPPWGRTNSFGST